MFPEHFPLTLLTHSDTAIKLGIANVPNKDQVANLEWGANFILTPIRALLATPILITSGFRASGVNVRDHGVAHSQHMTGCAVDIFPEGWTLNQAAESIRLSNIAYDQLILEDACIHVSWTKNGTPRLESLRRTGTYPNFLYHPVTSFIK